MAKGGWQFAETKRARSRRLIKLQAWVVALFRKQAEEELEARGDILLFRARRGGPIREPRFVQDYFKPLLRSVELPAIRLYDLRHYAGFRAIPGEIVLGPTGSGSAQFCPA
jgi:hypothetical protein